MAGTREPAVPLCLCCGPSGPAERRFFTRPHFSCCLPPVIDAWRSHVTDDGALPQPHPPPSWPCSCALKPTLLPFPRRHLGMHWLPGPAPQASRQAQICLPRREHSSSGSSPAQLRAGNTMAGLRGLRHERQLWQDIGGGAIARVWGRR